MRIVPVLVGTLCVACVAGVSEDDAPDSGGKADGAGSAHELAGFDETLLVGDEAGALAVVHVGETFSRKTVALEAELSPTVIRATGGKFYALFDSGTLAVIDSASAKVEHSIAVGASPQDIEWASDQQIYVSSGSQVATIELATGAELATIDLASLRIGDGSVQTRRMLRVDERLFVQVARRRADHRAERGALAVIDTARGVVEKTIELDGINPDFDLVHDARRGQLYVTCAGTRPTSTGVLVRIDTATLEVHDRKPAQSGWQGIVAFAEPFENLFMIYHTSTPTTSSHLFAFPVADDGTIGSFDGGTIVDAFDGLDALAINEAGTLVAMANHCAVGFCVGGAGINFIDATTREKLPKLMKDALGFEPVIVQFAR